jgi:hypothetical protein
MKVYMRPWPPNGEMPTLVQFVKHHVAFGCLRSGFGYVYLVDGTNVEHLRKDQGPEFTIVKRRMFRTGMPPAITRKQIGFKTLRTYFYLGEWEQIDGVNYVDETAWDFIKKYNISPGRYLKPKINPNKRAMRCCGKDSGLIADNHMVNDVPLEAWWCKKCDRVQFRVRIEERSSEAE